MSDNYVSRDGSFFMKPQVFISKLVFNDGTEMTLKPSDIVIFTGANNVGKSQVLRDIDNRMTKDNYNTIVLKTLHFTHTGNIKELEETFKKDEGGYNLSGFEFCDFMEIANLWDKNDRRFSYLFKNRIDTEGRLNVSNNGQSFDALHQEPTTPIQLLYKDDTLEKKLSDLFHEAFDESLIVNRAGGDRIPLHVGIPPEFEQGEDRVSHSYLTRLEALPELQSQGDGMRSFVGILLEVFTTQKTITMIDEPEAFLHPPQARLIGRMLVKNKPNDRQLFISTHSEDFLKGLLDAESDNVKIVRINREGNKNQIKVLDNDGVRMLWKDSILRYSNILSGLFHSKVVICESDTDCRFYQAILDSLYENRGKVSPDILFTHSNGKERLKVVVKALKTLNVKVVVVPDIDILDNEITFKNLCVELGIGYESLKSKWKLVTEYVKQQRAQLDTDEAKKDIIAILDNIQTPQLSKDDIEQIKRKLKASSAWAKVKEVGKAFFSGEAYVNLNELMSECKKDGLFIVPVGELEAFYKPAANKHGTAWIDEVMKLDMANEEDLDEARKFVKEISEF